MPHLRNNHESKTYRTVLTKQTSSSGSRIQYTYRIVSYGTVQYGTIGVESKVINI